MLLFSALWLAVVHALATLAVPAGPVDGPSRLAGVAAAQGATSAERARLWALLGDEQLRPAAPQRLRAVDRTSDRSVPPLRTPLGLAAVASAELALSLASLTPLARHRVSHAAASRGGLLAYFPTAPPLQG